MALHVPGRSTVRLSVLTGSRPYSQAGGYCLHHQGNDVSDICDIFLGRCRSLKRMPVVYTSILLLRMHHPMTPLNYEVLNGNVIRGGEVLFRGNLYNRPPLLPLAIDTCSQWRGGTD